jgi:hypothetical protein
MHYFRVQQGELSPDGLWRWDGTRWVAATARAPLAPGDISPDRLWRWDGSRWVPAASAAPPPVLGPPMFVAPTVSATRPRSWFAIGGGVSAIVGAILIVTACALPHLHYTDSSAGGTPSPSVFNPGFAPSNWFAAEPVGVALLALAAGILLVVWTNPISRAIASGVLVAYGVQTFLLFLGYLALAVGSSSSQVGPGGIVGMFAGVILFVGGVVSAVGLFMRRTGAPKV